MKEKCPKCKSANVELINPMDKEGKRLCFSCYHEWLPEQQNSVFIQYKMGGVCSTCD